MNQFFQLFGGSIALLSSIFTCIVIGRRWRYRRSAQTRKHLVPVLYWSPIFLMCCMVLHNVNNGLNTIALVSSGESTFTFYHYSYQLFGFVLGYQSYLLLQQCRKHVEGTERVNRRLYRSMVLILVTTLPTFIFTPIGIVPAVVLVINFIVSLAVHKSPATKTIHEHAIAFEEIEIVDKVLLYD